MPRKSNVKGGNFERLGCRTLTAWVTGRERPEIFWRSATSGAKATSEAKAGRESYMGGDIIAVRPEGQWLTDAYSLEFKDRKSIGTLPFMLQGRAEMLEWWQQCVSDASRAGKRPLMIFKGLRTPVFAGLAVNDGVFSKPVPYCLISVWEYPAIVVTPLAHLLKENGADEVKRMLSHVTGPFTTTIIATTE